MDCHVSGEDQKKLYRKALLAGISVAALLSVSAHAQDDESNEELEEIVVVGSQIKGARVSGTLPVSVMSSDDIDNTGAASGDELFRAIPQAGFVAFNDNNVGAGVNAARGDVNSINLRGLGTGNTLGLLNGRRMVLHPGFQTENLVPVVTVNSNTIPTLGVGRVEVLRDGAGAIYGADAVGGVVNTVLRHDFEGITAQVRYGASDGTSRDELTASFQAGFNFNEGATHLALFGSYQTRSGVPASERPYSASSDRRPLVEGTAFEGDSEFRNTSSSSPWGRFRLETRIDSLGDDDFHIQPSSLSGCIHDLGNGLCIDNGGSVDESLRFDFDAERYLNPDLDRLNSFAMLTHEFENGVEYYAELGFYKSKTQRPQTYGLTLSASRYRLPADAYWNPFGPTTLADGTPNPNRLPGLTDVPEEGLEMTVYGYRPTDLGPRLGTVRGESYRLLSGLRGQWKDWDWDTAVVYSEAKSRDLTKNRISSTLLQQEISKTTSDAFNPFLGPTGGNSQASLDAIAIDVRRNNSTSLFLADFKVSNPAIYSLPAGDVGVALGVEARRESFEDDRDERLDGTITFTDAVTGDFKTESDVVGSSPTPDTSGSRWVKSAFVEFAVPLVSPEMDVPLMQSLDLQIAGRYEDFDYSGTTAKPKIALSWVPTDGLLFRGSWSKGFRAPNLVQLFDTGIRRQNTRDDYVQCQAQIEKGIISDFGDCSGDGIESVRSGARSLENENSTQFGAGIVIQPEVFPGLTITADYWSLKQNNLIGILGDQNQIALDLVLRQSGGSNPNVIRRAPDADQQDLFAGTSLAAVGEIIEVRDAYLNLDSRKVEGLDLAIIQDIETNDMGNFTIKLNAARLLTFEQSAGETSQSLIDNSPVNITGFGDLMEQNGRPKWRMSLSMNWKKDNYGAGLFARYVGAFDDTSARISVNGEDVYWRVEDWTTVNANVHYTFEKGALEDTQLRLGVNNLFDKQPPLADENFGFFGSMHNPIGRFFYIDLKKTF
ncbi:TonB-dependent receptor [Temperatibacter marinus]|uniref:TonB-dependent receptor n=1 Tax=Temperatibacter marinus TaxID=1456591 RepID=A0AA52EFU2_9PROT|nr:TonB-dependent receptor [Temperatibacter marinus]WND01752.1 TonB-dependent receptor [Temperatibacter marinus]